jgi:hypothetical protein
VISGSTTSSSPPAPAGVSTSNIPNSPSGIELKKFLDIFDVKH